MAYVKRVWTDRLVEKPLTFSVVENVDGTITLIPNEGKVIQEGTKINAENMNNIENMISELKSNITTYTTLYNGLESDKADKLLPAWTTVTPLNYWINDSTNPCQYFKDSQGMVHLRGIIRPGTLYDGVVIFTLPDGFRPIRGQDNMTKCLGSGGLNFTTFSINTNGDCRIWDNIAGLTSLYINNIHFPSFNF